ncbi:hypothetical protein K5R88_02800 [Pseudomonas sp. MM213]|uniref:ADP-ribosyltransferase exoenzyme n=1 Tax=Pseudomonas migulae TaxID=78543 RepID=A0ABY8MZS7_9PSED|nr:MULTISPECIES: hypothetical protein [Pseudomonas]UCP10589.1 hypothetical protein K5R88_02800 [Pseudomonas sp. MM213]WGK92888.1 hypothetical protein MOQ58_12100 [Pseudomonas migulae]
MIVSSSIWQSSVFKWNFTLMRRLDLLECYPLNNGEVSDRDRQFHDAAVKNGWPTRPLHETKYANNAHDFAHIAADHGGANNAFNMLLEQKLKDSPVYRNWIGSMPNLYEVPGIKNYRDERITPSLLQELGGLSATLSPGQFLFHGGAWPGELKVGSRVRIDRPFSTSLNANPAIAHAYKDDREVKRGIHLWVIEVGNAFYQPVYVYNIISQRKFKQEFEVLIHPGSEAVCQGVDYSGECTVISVLLN